jgi:hypothetical protein
MKKGLIITIIIGVVITASIFGILQFKNKEVISTEIVQEKTDTPIEPQTIIIEKPVIKERIVEKIVEVPTTNQVDNTKLSADALTIEERVMDLEFGLHGTQDEVATIQIDLEEIKTKVDNFTGQTAPIVVKGCMNSDALNYNPSATEDDGSCIDKVLGCMDIKAINYNASANVSDTCKYTPIPTTMTFSVKKFMANDGSIIPINSSLISIAPNTSKITMPICTSVLFSVEIKDAENNPIANQDVKFESYKTSTLKTNLDGTVNFWYLSDCRLGGRNTHIYSGDITRNIQFIEK